MLKNRSRSVSAEAASLKTTHKQHNVGQFKLPFFSTLHSATIMIYKKSSSKTPSRSSPQLSKNPVRVAAYEAGQSTYSDPDPDRVCPRGHESLRYVSSGSCVYCTRLMASDGYNKKAFVPAKKDEPIDIPFSTTALFKKRVKKKGIHNLDFGVQYV